MTIVHIVNRFVPDAGNQINLLSKYEKKCGNEITIITPRLEQSDASFVNFYGTAKIDERDSVFSNNTGVKILRVKIKRYISGRAQYYKGLYDLINCEKPDIVFVHGCDTIIAMNMLLRHKRLPYPIVMDVHMVEIASQNKFAKVFRLFYKNIFARIINKYRIPVIRIQDDDYANRCLGINIENTPFISVGSDPDIFHPDQLIRKRFREKNRIRQDEFVVLYAGKLDSSKGAAFLAEAIKDKLSIDRDVCFVIVGNTSGEYGEKIEESFRTSENRIIRFNTQPYVNLAEYYQASDLVVYPKQCSLSFYDAQACGVSVLFEDIGVNISRTKYGTAWVFKQNDREDFRNKLTYLIGLIERHREEIMEKATSYISKYYNYEVLTKEYLRIIEKTIRELK